MRVSFVLRLDPDLLATGEFVGDVEEVESGRREGVRRPDDIVDFCRASATRTSAGTAHVAPPLTNTTHLQSVGEQVVGGIEQC